MSRFWTAASLLERLRDEGKFESDDEAVWDQDDMRSVLVEEGATFLDDGAFAEVYVDPVNPDLVVKVQKNYDPCFEGFVEEIGESGNPHLPNVVDRETLEGDGTEIYEIERLKPLDRHFLELAERWSSFPAKVAVFALAWGQTVRAGETSTIRRLTDVRDWLLSEAADFGMEEYDYLTEFIRDCGDPMCMAVWTLLSYWNSTPENCRFDLHLGNVMTNSSGDIVFTDPFASDDFLPYEDYEEEW